MFDYQSVGAAGAIKNIVTPISVQEDYLASIRPTSPTPEFQFADCRLDDSQRITAVAWSLVQIYGKTRLVCEALEQRGVANFRITFTGYEKPAAL